MNFYPKNIPKEMKRLNQWVLFVKETVPGSDHPKKQMISVTGERWHKAKSTEPADWASFTGALQALNHSHYDGMVFCLSEGIVFIDIDNSIDDEGNLSDLAQAMLNTFPDTYAERSCSGHGIHIFLKGRLPDDSMKRNDSIGLEVYDTKRFACMTGDMISRTNELADYQEEFTEMTNLLLGKRERVPNVEIRSPLSMDDEEILRRAMRSKAGPKIARLYAGDISDYPSQSNADMAFMTYMAFWTRNPNQLDSIMRSSGLFREKWDEARGNTTYGRITIESALAHMTTVYGGGRHQYTMS